MNLRHTKLFLSVTLGSLLLPSCSDRGADIHLVVPGEFHGLITLIEDKKNGEDVDLNAPYFYLPQDGVLRLKTLAPFQKWHVLTASYLTGRMIPIGSLYDSPNAAVKIYGLGGTARKNFYFLGSLEEAGEAHGSLSQLSTEQDKGMAKAKSNP